LRVVGITPSTDYNTSEELLNQSEIVQIDVLETKAGYNSKNTSHKGV